MFDRAGRRAVVRGQILCGTEALERRMLLSDSPVMPAAPSASITGLTLINADTGQPVPGFQFKGGATIDLSTTGHRLNIRADLTAGAVGSVRFNYDGDPNYKIENYAPYDIGGDDNGGRTYLPWLPAVGMHTLVVTPYSGKNGAGRPGAPLLFLFNVLDSSPAAAPIRVNAGGPTYTDRAGVVFTADMGFDGGRERRSRFAVSGTPDAALYQSYREGKSFSFAQLVPDGTYALTLYFAEPTERTGRRLFDVAAEGKSLLDDFDIAAAAGPRTALEKTFLVPVVDGNLDVSFHGEVGQAIVSAISIVPQRTPLNPAPVYVNAGGLSYTDSLARTFAPSTGFVGGVTSQAPFAVGSTSDAPLFYSYRSGAHFTFTRPVANGDYELFLDFADPTSTRPGQRAFDLSAEGHTILSDYDIVANAGAHHAVVKAFDVQVTGGTLGLSFQGVTGDAIVSSIVLIPKDIPLSAMPYAIQCAPDRLKELRDLANLQQLGLGIFLYANAQTRNGNALPPDLPTLFSSVEFRPGVFASPRTATLVPRGEMSAAEQTAWVRTLTDYIYLGAGKSIDRLSSSDPVVYDNPDRVSGDINVLFGDGHVGRLTRDAAAKLIGFTPADPTQAPLPMNPGSSACKPDVGVLLSAGNLFVIGRGAFLFAEEATRNGSPFPPDLGRLANFSDIDPEVFVNPRGSSPPPPAGLTTYDEKAAWIDTTTDYTYVPFHKGAMSPASAVLAYENPAAMKDGALILFADTHVEFRDMRWAIETILHDQAAFPRK